MTYVFTPRYAFQSRGGKARQRHMGLRLLRREVAGVPMGQFQGHCGARALISATEDELVRLIGRMSEVGRDVGMPMIGRREARQLTEQARGLGLLPDFETLLEATHGWRMEPLRVHVETLPIEIDRGTASIFTGKRRLHETPLITSTQAVDMIAWLAAQHGLSVPEQKALLRDALAANLTPHHPHAWLLSNGVPLMGGAPYGVSPDWEVMEMIRFRRQNGIDRHF